MDHSNNFVPMENKDRERMENKENANVDAASAEPQERAPVPQWYSVSYQTGGRAWASPTVEHVGDATDGKKKRRRRAAFISLALVLCILISAVSGVGAYLVMDHLKGDIDQPGGNLQLGGSTELDGIHSSSYANTDVGYDYPAAIAGISKSNDQSLLNSANGSAGETGKSLIEVTAAVKDSVVEITTTVVSNRGSSVVAGAGSGVIIHADGIVVTNHHVIADCDQIYVRLTNGDTYEAVLRGSDEDGDIALLKITPQEGKPLTVAKLGYSKALALGEEVIAIGNPLGELGGTVTNGIISATEREINMDGVTMKLLQTNAAINSGNSGGGLFNMAGELIGIVNAKYAAAGVEGLGFAIPVDIAYEESILDLLEYGYIRGVPCLGPTLIEQMGGNLLNVIYAAYVYDPGANTAFAEGDYIYSIDGTVVYGVPGSALDAIKAVLRTYEVGDTVEVIVKRGSEKKSISVVLQEYIPASAVGEK